MKTALLLIPILLLAGCRLTSDSLFETVQSMVARGEITPQMGQEILSSTAGTVGHYAELATSSLIGAAMGYFGIQRRRKLDHRQQS